MANTNTPQARSLQNNANRKAERGAPLFQLFYGYSALFTDLDAGETLTQQIQIQADSDFEIQAITASVYTSTGALQTGNAGFPTFDLITVQLTDTGSGANIFDQAQPLNNIAGFGNLPFILPVSKILSANSQLGVQITNSGANNDLIVYMSFLGKKLYRAG